MHNIPDIIIAIDGYSSTGKSSFAKLIAKEFSFLYLDSGALYRAVTLYAMEHGMVREDGSIDKDALVAALPGIDIHFEYFYRRPMCGFADQDPGCVFSCESGGSDSTGEEFRG